MSRPNISLAERLKDAGLLINNSLADSIVMRELINYKYTEARLLDLKSQLERIIHLTELQKKEYGEQHQATETLEIARAKAEIAYKISLKLARIAFRNHPAAAGALLLDGIRKSSTSGFLEQSRTFYNNLLANTDFVTIMVNYNCTKEKLLDEKELVDQVSIAFEKQQQERGDAIQATLDRDKILDSFEQEIADLSAICKIAFNGQEDILISLGL